MNAAGHAAMDTTGTRPSQEDCERRVLILAPLGNDAGRTSDFLCRADLHCHICADFGDLMETAARGCGAMVIAEEALEDRALTRLAAMLAEQPSWSELPICIIGGGHQPVQFSLRRLAGYAPKANITVLERPFHPETLVCSVEAALRSRIRQYQVRDLLQSVREKEERLENLLGSISDAFAALDRNWRFTYANRAFMELVGSLFRSANQLLGESVWTLFPDIRHQEMGLRFQQAMDRQQPDAFEVYYAPLDAWLDLRVFPTPELLSIYVRDISQRKATEQALTESEVRFRATFDQASTMISILDTEGSIKDINNSALAAYKMAEKSEIGLCYWDSVCWRGCEVVRGHIRDAVKAAVRGEASHFETAYFTAEGEERWTDLYITPIKDADRLVFILSEGHDITELRQARRALEGARDMAVQASRAKDDFLASLSHELRTPLNPVLLVASEGATNLALPDDVRKDFDAIRKNVALEARLIDDLLDLTLITRGKMKLEVGAHDLHSILTDAIANVRTDALQKDLTIATRFYGAPMVWGDAVRLQQVFWNVLKNAVKFTPRSGEVMIQTLPTADEGVCIRITDNGIGMTESELNRIFRSFTQGDHANGGGSHRFGGLGLGLAISSKLVEMHDGKIKALSDGPGKGASFEICLPTAPVAAQAVPIAGTAPTAGPHSPQYPQWRILLVEDHEPTRNTLERLLRRRGYNVVCAATVHEARLNAAKEKFDLVISDIGLPDGTGNELMHHLRRNHGLRGIAVTGYGMEEDIAQTRRSGFISHLTKPVTVQALESALLAAAATPRKSDHQGAP
jgi:PAS domain S-box-containing protein